MYKLQAYGHHVTARFVFRLPSFVHNASNQNPTASFHVIRAYYDSRNRRRTNSSRPSLAIRSLGQASRRIREQDALHHAKNEHSNILDLYPHLEATDRMTESQERRYPHPRPDAELNTRADPNLLPQQTQVPLELECINSQRCERRQSRCSP